MRNPLFPALFAGFILLYAGLAGAAPFSAAMVDPDGKPLPDAVITLAGGTRADIPRKADMDQRNQQFLPHVLAVHTGTEVRFPNSDDIRHQVYSFSAAKRFELRLYGGTPTAPVLFEKPGLVVLGCNIHDWMLGYIYVTEDPWFTVSDAQGIARLDLPAGRYAVTLWHPRLPDAQPLDGGTVEVAAGGLQKRFTLDVQAHVDNDPAAPAPSAFGDAFRKATQQ